MFRRIPAVPAALSAAVLLARLSPVPEPVALVGTLPAGARLDFPLAYEVLAPLSVAADRLSLLSASQWAAFGAWLLSGWLAWRLLRKGAKRPLAEAKAAALAFAAFAAFVAWAVWSGRPMARLLHDEPDALLVDFHSHTSRSWDGRSGFTPEANARWHARAGFDASFVTDHETWQGAFEAAGERAGLRSLVGVEVRLYGLHLAVAGCRETIDREPFKGPDRVAAGIGRYAQCGLAIASLPEYRRHHWGASGDGMAGWPIDGLELVNGAPKGLDLRGSDRRRVAELCRERGVACVSATDTHGWGAAPPAWTVLRLPRWRGDAPEALERRIVGEVRERGFESTSVAARARIEFDEKAELAVDPLRQLALALRAMTPTQAAVALAWIWVGWLLPPFKRS